jgi:hypothetical protein
MLTLWLDSKDIYRRRIVWKIEMRFRGIWLMVVRILMMIS